MMWSAILVLVGVWLVGSAMGLRMTMKKRVDIAIFSDQLMRVHDNPMLRRSVAQGAKVIPLYVGSDCDSLAVKQLERRLGVRKLYTADSSEQVKDFLTSKASQYTSDSVRVRVLHHRDMPKMFEDGMAEAKLEIDSVEVDDLLHDISMIGNDLDALVLANPVYSAIKDKIYSSATLSKYVPLPNVAMEGLEYCEEIEKEERQTELAEDDEELKALNLVKDYLQLGENEFTERYAQLYCSVKALSDSHRKSLDRLVPSANAEYSEISLFTGEVCSGLISDACSRGLISPRLLLKARDASIAGQGLWQATPEEIQRVGRPSPFNKCQLREDVIRRDWQQRVMRASEGLCKDGISPAGYQESFNIAAGGYLERTGVMFRQAEEGSSENGKLPPLAVLVHGFGGSMDQMAGLSRELNRGGFEVLGIDLVGFGRSEKPPLSYNQYYWRDQVIQAVMRHQKDTCEEREREVVFFGNSIGGFTAASTAAAFAEPVITDTANIIRDGAGVKVSGLVLFNSAGRIITPAPNSEEDGNKQESKSVATSTLTVEEEMDSDTDKYRAKFYPPYSGPPGPLLRLFGSGLIAALQPQIRKTTEWLYPSQPQVVKQTGLDKSILRDSLDPGARDVMASGAKLPAPVSIDALLQCYKGPVLIAQGALDPLNDAVTRAAQFGAIRDRVQVELLQLGHCPMDEDPKQCAQAVLKWWGSASQDQGTATTTVADTSDNVIAV